MKTLSKKLLSFLMAICMIGPIFAQSAQATDNVTSSGIPEGCVAVSNDETVSFSAEPIEVTSVENLDDEKLGLNASARNVQLGTRVQNAIVYPLGYNIDTNELFINTAIYKRVVYNTNFQQSAGVRLSNSDTLLLMQQMMDYMGSLEGNYALVGWHLQGIVLFGYDYPQYLLYTPTKTFVGSTDQQRLDLSGSNVYVTFRGNFTFPQNVDVLKDYYYIGFSGACYYRTSSGQQSDALFGISGAFNC